MTNWLVRFLLLGTVMLGASSSGQEPDYDGELPLELRELARQIGCEPVPGFYKKPGMVDPPYLYGYLPGDKEKTAAFWCYRENENKPYLLVFVESLGNGRAGRVSSTIAWHNHPGGLSLCKSAHVPLSDFRYVDNPEVRGPDKSTEYAPLMDYYDGVATSFIKKETGGFTNSSTRAPAVHRHSALTVPLKITG